MKATPQAHLARAELEEGEPVAGREPVVETDRARVYCPAEVLQQEEGWGGGGSSGGNNLSRARGIAGEEASSAAFQGQVGCEEGMPHAKAASSLCLRLPTTFPGEFSPCPHPELSTLVSHPHSWSLACSCPSQWDAPPNCRLLLLPSV